jgi:hypothetical protein
LNGGSCILEVLVLRFLFCASRETFVRDQMPPQRRPDSQIEPLTGPKMRAVLVVATAVALTAVFWPRLWQGGGLIGGDIYSYYLPQKAFYADCLREGTLPLWNNRVGNGYPQLAESQTGALYPLNLVLYRCLDLNTAYNTSVLMHYCLAFVGCWLLARRFDLTPLAAVLAALVYTYGWFPPRISLEWAIVGGAWLPVAVWCVESFVQQSMRRWLVMLSVTLALQLLAGHFLIAFLTQLLIVVYVPFRLWFAGGTRSGRGAACAWLIVALAWSYLLSAAQLVPTWELKRLSQRSGVNAEHDPGIGAVPAKYLEQVVAPWIWYRDSEAFKALHDPAQRQRINRVDAHLYFGMLPLLFIAVGLWGAWRDSNRRMLIWLALGIAAIFYMPGWFLPIARHLPGFSYFEGPGRYGIVATLAAALLAATGFQVVGRSLKPLVRPIYVVAVLIVTTADLVWVSDLVHEAEQVENPPIKLLPHSPLRANIAWHAAEPVRLFSEGHNIPSLTGAGTLPVYLGLSPAAYYDPQLTMPKPYPFRDKVPTPEQIDWMRRMGVTHILTLTMLDEQAWPVKWLWLGSDPCLNPVLIMGPTNYLAFYELQGSRKRAAWLETGSGPPPRLVKYTPQRVEIAAESERGGTLVLTDLDYPGWRVEVDGRPAVGVVVDGMLRGVAVPAGAHTVTWSYRPASFFWGAGISAVSLVVLALFAYLPRPATSKSDSVPPARRRDG